MSTADAPFVWTKIGDDAGEAIGGILARKEAERRAGTFWWGIGSSLDRERLRKALAAGGETLPVLFSTQLSRPRRRGSGGMTLWRRWRDDAGVDHEIPGHALVVSGDHSVRYYALVCESDRSIASLCGQPFNEQLFRNYPDGAQPGDSQNTALLTGNIQANHANGRYRMGFSAFLVRPWLVTLADPRPLTREEQELVANWDGQDYSNLLRCIRN